MGSITGSRAAGTALAAVAAAGLLLLAGCSAGQQAATAEKRPSVIGANIDAELPGGTVSIRNAAVVYRAGGYPAGADAPIELRLVNNTSAPVPVEVSVDPAVAAAVTLGGGAAPAPDPTSAAPSASATGSPSPGTGSPSPGAPSATASASGPTATPSPAARPARLTIPPADLLASDPTGADYLQLAGLRNRLRPGESVTLVFTFPDGVVQRLVVPMAVPIAEIPRATGAATEEH